MSETVLGTVDGRPVTQEVVEAIVANAEAGYPGVRLRRVGRPLMGDHPARTIAVRLDPDLDAALLDRMADSQATASEVVRDALRRYLQPA